MKLTLPPTDRAGRCALPTASDGSRRRFLEIPALAGQAEFALEGRAWRRIRASWTPQRLELPTSEAGELRWHLRPDREDPFAGFLPEIGLPPRGLWQGMRVWSTGQAAFLARPRATWRAGTLQIDAPWSGPSETRVRIVIGSRRLVAERLHPAGRIRAEVPEPRRWSPRDPRMDRIQLELWVGEQLSDRVELPWAHRRIEARGCRLLLNSEVLSVRGLLHWGNYGDGLGPDPEPQQLRSELRAMRARGFNLLKACLWLPSERFLRICDEEGMLVWVEYPLWRRALRGPRMVAAYRRFAEHDAHHPCVILRTMTCENDELDPPSVRAAYRAIHDVVPSSLVADNSGWLDTNVVADFHDEHPYLNNAQWPAYLERTSRALTARPEQPLLLGESLVSDADARSATREQALAVRRFQIESFQRHFPHAGYVVCAAIDLEDAPLGLRNRRGQWKDESSAWSWQGRGVTDSPTTERIRSRFGGPRPPRVESLSIGVRRWKLPDTPLPTGVKVANSLLQSLGSGQRVLDALREGARILLLPELCPGAWRIPEHLFWSPSFVFDRRLERSPMRELLRDLLTFDLLRGRVLVPTRGGCSLLQVRDLHGHGRNAPLLPLIVAGQVGRGRLLVSALEGCRTAAGRWLHAELADRILRDETPLPELEVVEPAVSHFLNGPWTLRGANVLGGCTQVEVGTPIENLGRNVFQGWAEFTGRFEVPASLDPTELSLRAEAIGDGWELRVDGRLLVRHGNLEGTWDGGRDRPLGLRLDPAWLRPGVPQEWRLRVKDWRGAGGLVGPLYLSAGDPEASVLY